MIRIVGKSLGITIAMALIGIGTCVSVAQAQYIDDSSDIPPSPSPAPYKSSQWGSVPVGIPTPTMTSPPQSTSTNPPAYSMSKIPGTPQRQIRTVIPANPNRPPQIVGPYGAGGRRPDVPKVAYEPSRKVTLAAHAATAATPSSTTGPGKVTTARFDEASDAGFMAPIPPPASDVVNTPMLHRHRPPLLGPGAHFPMDRVGPPTIMGSHLGLLPGETATERSLRLMSHVGDLERQVEAFDQRNTEQCQLIKQRDDQLLLAIREIKTARKEVGAARDELEQLRRQVKALQEKVRDAERDNAALLQTMAPLLQKLLDADANPSDEAQE